MFEKESTLPKVSLRNDIRSHELILAVRRRFFWILGICILAYAAAFWYSNRYFYYTSKIIVDVSPAPVFLSNQDGSKQSVDIFKNGEYVMRILQFAHSNKMTDHLIKKFNLYAHYGLNPDSKYAYQKMNLILNGMIQAKKSLFENVVITVSDGDRDFAADMADEVAAETDRLAREYFGSALAGKMKYYEEIIKNLQEDFNRKSEGIASALSTIQSLKRSAHNDPDLDAKLLAAENSLLESTTQMDDIIKQVADFKKSQMWIQSMMDNKQINFVSVMQRAIPDQSNLFNKKVIVGLLGSFSAAWMCVLFLYLGMTYRRYFQLFFRR